MSIPSRLEELEREKRALLAQQDYENTKAIRESLRGTRWSFSQYTDQEGQIPLYDGGGQAYEFLWPRDTPFDPTLRALVQGGRVHLGHIAGYSVSIQDDHEISLIFIPEESGTPNTMQLASQLGILLDFTEVEAKLCKKRESLERCEKALLATIRRAEDAGVRFKP